MSENTQPDEIIGDYQLIESSMRFNKSQYTRKKRVIAADCMLYVSKRPPSSNGIS